MTNEEQSEEALDILIKVKALLVCKKHDDAFNNTEPDRGQGLEAAYGLAESMIKRKRLTGVTLEGFKQVVSDVYSKYASSEECRTCYMENLDVD